MYTHFAPVLPCLHCSWWGRLPVSSVPHLSLTSLALCCRHSTRKLTCFLVTCLSHPQAHPVKAEPSPGLLHAEAPALRLALERRAFHTTPRVPRTSFNPPQDLSPKTWFPDASLPRCPRRPVSLRGPGGLRRRIAGSAHL